MNWQRARAYELAVNGAWLVASRASHDQRCAVYRSALAAEGLTLEADRFGRDPEWYGTLGPVTASAAEPGPDAWPSGSRIVWTLTGKVTLLQRLLISELGSARDPVKVLAMREALVALKPGALLYPTWGGPMPGGAGEWPMRVSAHPRPHATPDLFSAL